MKYQLIDKNEKHVDKIVKAAKKASAVYLATDPDREGEAISWHVYEVLKERKVLDSKPVQRVVFHEVTKRAIQEAIEQPRDLSEQLVNAQQARRALDYLVGFNLSPLLWKKVRRGLSAGRVQSPALRLIVEREDEITAFRAQEYWTIEALAEQASQAFPGAARRLRRREGRAVHVHERRRSARAPSRRFATRRDGVAHRREGRQEAAPPQSRPRRSRPRRCNRKRRASSASARSAR